jgi:hypothetical protein
MLKMKKFSWPVHFAILAATFVPAVACANDPVAPALEPARIRLFGQNGIGVRYYPNSACIGGESVSVSGGLGDAFSSFLGTASNKSIGIPATPNTEQLGAKNGVLSKAYFREYPISPDQPITITMNFQSNPGKTYMYCQRIGTTFIPEKGKDYEGALSIRDGICMQMINELRVTPEGMVLHPVASSMAKPCE